MIYAVLLMHICLVSINYVISKSWLYPPVVFTLLWSIVLFLLILSGDFFYPISGSTLLIFLLGSLAFSAGGIVSLAHRFRVSPIAISENKWTSRVLDASLLLLLIMFPFYIQRLRELSAMSGISDFWIGLRMQTSSGFREDGFGLFAYVTMLGNLTSLAALDRLLKSSYSRRKTYLILMMTFLYQILSAARLGTIMLLFSIGCVLALNSRIKLKSAAILAISAVILFTVPAYFLGKGISKKANFSQNVTSMKENMQVYFLAGPVAFDQNISAPIQAITRGTSFLFFVHFLNAVGLSDPNTAPPSLSEYTYTPRLTNIYTVYLPYYSTFGLAGVTLIIFTLGVLLSFFYRFAVLGHPVYVILYSLGCSMLLITSGTDGFLTSLSIWIQAAIFSFLLYKVPPLTLRRDTSSPKFWLLFPRSGLPTRNPAR